MGNEMEALMDTVMTIASMAVICMLLELLLPKSALKSSVMIIIGVVFLITAATPIIELIQNNEQSFSYGGGSGFDTEMRGIEPYQDFLFDIFKNIE